VSCEEATGVTARRTSEEIRDQRESLIVAAREVVRRDGASALTVRAVAREAGCALGLPYKVFANREELVLELVAQELTELATALGTWVRTAGKHTVAGNLYRYARILLEADVPALMHANTLDDQAFAERVAEISRDSGLIHSFDSAIAAYLTEEQRLGRIRADVDTAAFGFLITGALHNLVTAGESYPRPSEHKLRAHLAACAAALAP
jgi:AcrR family transcriptional regulator